MRAVWTFWSAPYRRHYHRLWFSEQHHLFAWTLSVLEARRHYPDTCLCTDSWGARLLVDELRLPFRDVDLRLDTLNTAEADTDWWVLGKLHTYAAQRCPFLHLDNDVFLWKPLPQRLTTADLFAQNPEAFFFEDRSLYRLEPFVERIEQLGGWLPPQWHWYRARRGDQALCCGIVGGRNVAFLRRYAELAIAVIDHPRNQAVWPILGIRDNILVEQYFLAACLHFHHAHLATADDPLGVEYLFESSTQAFAGEAATRLGYTHLIGEAKNDPAIAERLERRLRRDHPRYYERCLAAAEVVEADAITPTPGAAARLVHES